MYDISNYLWYYKVESEVLQYFGIYITWLKQLKLCKVPALVGSIMVIGVIIHCALLHSLYDLKAVQMNVV